MNARISGTSICMGTSRLREGGGGGRNRPRKREVRKIVKPGGVTSRGSGGKGRVLRNLSRAAKRRRSQSRGTCFNE